MEFRNYIEEDVNEILKWIKNEREFRLWSATRYENYPIKPEDITEEYRKSSKNMVFYPMCLTDNGKTVGHIVVRIPENSKDTVRFGFVIVDSNIRGKGYGKKLIQEAIEFTKIKFNNIKEITLGVITINNSAVKCYESVGFKTTEIHKNFMEFEGEQWDCAEMSLKM